MNNKEFIQELANKTNTSVKNTQKLVNSILDEMGVTFEEGESISFKNLGTFEIKKRIERIITNPKNKKRMLVPPKLVLSFKPTTSIKQHLKKKGGYSNA